MGGLVDGILIFFDIFLNHLSGWVGGYGWVETCVHHHLIEEFCLKIYDLWTHSHLWIGVWVGGWVGRCFVKSLKMG